MLHLYQLYSILSNSYEITESVRKLQECRKQEQSFFVFFFISYSVTLFWNPDDLINILYATKQDKTGREKK